MAQNISKKQYDLIDIKGVGPVTKKKLNTLGINDVEDLVKFLPCRYIDLDAAQILKEVEEGDYVLLKLQVRSMSKPYKLRGTLLIRATGITEQGEIVKLLWFNASYIYKLFVVDDYIRVFGKVSLKRGIQLTNPKLEIYKEGETKFKGISAIYRLKNSIKQANFATMVEDALDKNTMKGFLSQQVEKKFDLMPYTRALEVAHKPKSISQGIEANIRLELDAIVRKACAYKALNLKRYRPNPYIANKTQIAGFLSTIPFALNKSQNEAIDKIITSLKSNTPLNAILVGDVGSGKTIVSLVSAYFAFLSKRQTVFIAPTEVLAIQHYNVFKDYLSSFGVNISLLTGSKTPSEKKQISIDLKEHKIDIIIGTHALLTKMVEFNSLSLVIIDEQHRFGVSQRNVLISKSTNADILMLSATPIPRSLRLIMLGEIDYIQIDNRFAKNNIKTRLVPKEKQQDMFEYIVSICENGGQAFFIAPKVYDCEGLDISNVEKLYKDLSRKYGTRVNIGYLHGKLSFGKKNKTLQEFANNNISILISTTVVEVGIDIPNANLMVIFDADRFGLATLHQLRGRIGRDGKESYCFILSENIPNERLDFFTKSDSGIAIAEYDFQVRGPGVWFGQEQSGHFSSAFSLPTKYIETVGEIVKEIDIKSQYQDLINYGIQCGLNEISIT